MNPLLSFFSTPVYFAPFILGKWPNLWCPVVILFSSLCSKMPCVIKILPGSCHTSLCNGRLASVAFRECNPLIAFYIILYFCVFTLDLKLFCEGCCMGSSLDSETLAFVWHLEYLEPCMVGSQVFAN